MRELILKPGPVLVARAWVYDDASAAGEMVDTAVTDRAHEYLFETVALEPDVCLQDIFGLLEQAPVLRQLLRRNFCEALLAEAKKGVAPEFTPGYAADGIEYLELYQRWNFNTHTREYQPMHRWNMHGVGYSLQETVDDGHGWVRERGSRTEWGVSGSPLRELLLLPVRVNPQVLVCEDDNAAKQSGHVVDEVRAGGISLGQVLDGLLWELSWFGGPLEQAAVVAELKQQIDSIDDEPAGNLLHDEVFGDLYAAGFAAFFDSIGTLTQSTVHRALRELEDDAPVQAALQALLGPDVVIKPDFALLGARVFRRGFLDAEGSNTN